MHMHTMKGEHWNHLLPSCEKHKDFYCTMSLKMINWQNLLY